MKNNKFIKITLYLFFFLLAAAVSYFRVFETYELATLDFRFKMRTPVSANKDIVIIEIADDSLEKIQQWPIDRNWHAAMIDVLSSCGVKAVLFDILFCEPSEHDLVLNESIKKAGNVYLSYALDCDFSKKGIPTAAGMKASLLEELSESAKRTGFINAVPDIDGKIRRVAPFIKYNGELYPALSVILASDYLGTDVNALKIPTDEHFMIVNYAGTWGKTFQHYSFIDILKSYSLITEGKKPIINLDRLKDKVCFVGLTATGTHDLIPTPLEPRYPGVGIQANTFDTIVSHRYVIRLSKIYNMAILLLLSIMTISLTLYLRPGKSIFAVIDIILGFALCSIVLFQFFRIWVEFFYPIIIIVLLYLSTTFYKYISEKHKTELVERELNVAKKIQESFLPEDLPESGALEVRANMNTAKQIGGDLYDFVDFKNGDIGIMIGDVSGKGVPAALYMANTVSDFRIFSKNNYSPKDVLTNINNGLLVSSKSNLFVTMSYYIFDLKNMRFIYSSAGHLPGILVKAATGEVIKTESESGAPLGLLEMEFGEQDVKLDRGDVFILYTDGVTEAMNKKRELFGMERFIPLVKENINLPPEAMIKAIQNRITEYEAGQQHDDITIIVAKVK